MGESVGMGKMLIVWGVLLIVVGFLLNVLPNVPWIGKLPGDIFIKKNGFRFYFPLTTCIVISLILTLLFNLFKR